MGKQDAEKRVDEQKEGAQCVWGSLTSLKNEDVGAGFHRKKSLGYAHSVHTKIKHRKKQ